MAVVRDASYKSEGKRKIFDILQHGVSRKDCFPFYHHSPYLSSMFWSRSLLESYELWPKPGPKIQSDPIFSTRGK